MKFILTVLMIRFIIALFEKKTKAINSNTDEGTKVKHPAAFILR